MRTFGLGLVLLWVAGCPDSGVDTDTLTTGTSEASTGSTGTSGAVPTTGDETSTTDGTTGATGSDGSGTGESSTTGEVDICTPTIDPIPEAMFVSTFINTICAQKVECGCADDMCSVKFKADLEDLVLYANSQGLVYDPECAAQALNDYVISRGCMNGEQANYPFCGSCSVYRGDLTEGQMCGAPLEPQIYLFSEPCADPGLCINDACLAPSDVPLKLGEVCTSDDVDILSSCEDGTACDFFDSFLCEPALAEGEPCLGPEGVCAGLLVCGDEGVCAPLLAPGAACDDNYDCASEYCDEFVCAEYVWICEVAEVGDLLGGVH